MGVGSAPAEAVGIDLANRGCAKAQQEAVESEVVKQPPQLRRRRVGIGAAEVGATAEVLERASVVQRAADLAQADLPDGWRADQAPEAGPADDDGREHEARKQTEHRPHDVLRHHGRSAARRVEKACVRTCTYRRSTSRIKKTQQ